MTITFFYQLIENKSSSSLTFLSYSQYFAWDGNLQIILSTQNFFIGLMNLAALEKRTNGATPFSSLAPLVVHRDSDAELSA